MRQPKATILTLDAGADDAAGEATLRAALALSLATGEPFRLEQFRARAERPGLLRTHLAWLRAVRDDTRANRDALKEALNPPGP